MDGCVDLGFRTEFDVCKYWVCDETNVDWQEYTYNNQPTGKFNAEETTAKERKKLIINNSFMFNEDLITLKTKSQISIKKGDLVEYEGEIWIVESSQSRKVTKSNQFLTKPPVITYIQLKR